MARTDFDTRFEAGHERGEPARKRARGAVRRAAASIVERLEDRQMLSVTLISENMAGTGAGNGASDEASVSANGQYVAFSSYATNIAPGAVQSGVENIYLRNLATNTTVLVSTGLGGAATNGNSESPKVSANGQYVVFASSASNLVANDTNNVADIFLANMSTGQITRVSVNSTGGNANAFSGEPVISDDGNYIGFSSYATDIAGTITTQHDNVYLDNVTTGQVQLLSQSTAGQGGNGDSYDPAISGGGLFVTFRSTATNLESAIPIAPGGNLNVYERNVAAGTTQLLSVDAAGTSSGNGNSISAQVSSDGSFVVFRSAATNLTLNDNAATGEDQVFLRNTTTNQTTLLSVDALGTGAAHGLSEFPSISSNGQYASFSSTAPDLIANNTNKNEQVYVRDLSAGAIYTLSVDDSTGAPANGASYHTFESSNGQFVSFTSKATDLTPFATGGSAQVYLATTPAAPTPTPTGTPTPTSTGPDTTPPTAVVDPNQVPPTTNSNTYMFNVDLADNQALNVVSLGNLAISGPASGNVPVTAQFVNVYGSGTSAVASYQATFAAPLTTADSGTYTVTTPAGAVKDATGNALAAGSLGNINLSVAPADSPDLVGQIISALPASAIGGRTHSRVTVRVTNQGTDPIVKTSVPVSLYLSETNSVLPGATPFTTVTKKLTLAHGKSANVAFNVAYPATLPNGNYYLVADIDPHFTIVETNKVNNVTPSPKTIAVAPPFTALAAVAFTPVTTALNPGHPALATLTIKNSGNVPASGPLTINLTTPTVPGDLSGTAAALTTIRPHINIKAGGTSTIKIKFAVPASATAGTYYLSATIDPTNAFHNPNPDQTIATATRAIQIT